MIAADRVRARFQEVKRMVFMKFSNITALIGIATGSAAFAQDQCSIAALGNKEPISLTDAIARFRKISLKKDEFETTAAYQARVAAVQNSLPTGDMLIAIPQEGLTTFNADLGHVTVSPYAVANTCLTDGFSLSDAMKAVQFGSQARFSNGPYCITKRVGSEDGRAYEATNGYGAKVTVSTTTVRQLGVYFGMGATGQQLFAGRKRYSSDPLFDFEASPDDARSLKQHAQILVLVKPTAPFSGVGSYYLKPTFDRPTEMTLSTEFLVAQPLCFAVGDALSKRVFASLPVVINDD